MSPYLVRHGRRGRDRLARRRRGRLRAARRAAREAAVHQRRQRHHADHEHAAQPRPRRAARRRAPALGAHRGRRDLRRRAARAGDEARRLPAARAAHGRAAAGWRPTDLDELCPDWREREAFVSGPGEMLDALDGALGARTATPTRLHMERFQPKLMTEDAEGEGGTIVFLKSGCEVETDGTKPILVAGEEAGLDAALRLPRGHLPHLRRDAALRAGCATCATARSTARTARWSAPASTRPRGASRSSSERAMATPIENPLHQPDRGADRGARARVRRAPRRGQGRPRRPRRRLHPRA